MSGGNETGRRSLEGFESLRRPEFKFTRPESLVFLTGVPLSGKSTIAPLVSSSIEGCMQQSMDIIRLVAQRIEEDKPEQERNPFVQYGSCDSYLLIGDGSYSPESMLRGFNLYSEAVCSILTHIIPNLETQGVGSMLFEGVQLTPSIVSPYLTDDSRLIVVTSSEEQLERNRYKLFGNNPQLQERYSTEKLVILQNEILRQAKESGSDRIILVDNIQDVRETAAGIISALLKQQILQVAQ